jgi:hypothetical protein
MVLRSSVLHCSGLLMTIGFASNVGKMLREFDSSEGYEPQSGYRFYMSQAAAKGSHYVLC